MLNFSRFIENRIENIKASDNFAFALAIGTGSWIAPISPAVIFGYSLWKSAPEDMGEFRIVTAVTVAVGLVVAGAVSSHNAITSKSLKPWLLVVAYISLEIIGLWLMSVSFEVKVVGTVASLLTLIVYLSRTNANEIDAEKKDAKTDTTLARESAQVKLDFQMEQARLNADHAREQERIIADQKHAERLARIEVKAGQSGSNDRVMGGQNGSFDPVKEGQMTGSNDPQMTPKESKNDPRKLKTKERQERIADLILDYTKPEIAKILGVSLSTVKRDVRQLNGKLEAK